MKMVGITAEYNPFHTGHAYQIAQTRAALGEDCPVIAVMSGNWVQQADCAIADKWTRAKMAVLGGADLVLELPTVWAVSSAESFARGAVSLLAAAAGTIPQPRAPNFQYFERPNYRYPYYDENGKGKLLYGYGGPELYQYKSYSPLEGIY